MVFKDPDPLHHRAYRRSRSTSRSNYIQVEVSVVATKAESNLKLKRLARKIEFGTRDVCAWQLESAGRLFPFRNLQVVLTSLILDASVALTR